jgi:predicted nucleic acid-binding protein
VLFDTDIFIWVQRGNLRAASLIEGEEERLLSVVSYMELLQCAHDKREQEYVRDFMIAYDFSILPLSENIGHRASIYIEEYSLSSGLRAADAIVAATATEANLTLATSNAKHFRPIKDLKTRIFKP